MKATVLAAVAIIALTYIRCLTLAQSWQAAEVLHWISHWINVTGVANNLQVWFVYDAEKVLRAKLFMPGFEPGTSSVWVMRHNQLDHTNSAMRHFSTSLLTYSKRRVLMSFVGQCYSRVRICQLKAIARRIIIYQLVRLLQSWECKVQYLQTLLSSSVDGKPGSLFRPYLWTGNVRWALLGSKASANLATSLKPPSRHISNTYLKSCHYTGPFRLDPIQYRSNTFPRRKTDVGNHCTCSLSLYVFWVMI